jgi:2-polyprenyl-3-methyl-5-hydroxy-6-metoxy-1,4-benzoquinol methylase
MAIKVDADTSYDEGAANSCQTEYVRLLHAYENNIAARELYEKGEVSEWMYMKHYSTRRLNVVRWMKLREASNILEIGAGCGSFTQELLRYSKKMVSIDSSALMCKLNYYRNLQNENLSVYLDTGDLDNIDNIFQEKYDYIVVWDKLSLCGLSEAETLRLIRKSLKAKGKLFWAADNPLGLRYLAGYKDEDSCTFFEVPEAEENEGKYTLGQIKALVEEVGLSADVYYPFPSYDFLNSVYSDEWMPKTGELERTEYPFKDKRLVTFKEGSVANKLIKEDLYRYFSNSYIVVIQGD